MDNISTIVITSLATLVVTILGGLVIEYFKRIKPKLIYSITDAVPIAFEDKTIGANVTSINNPSSKTIKDISIKIKTSAQKIQDGGIKATEGLDYEVSSDGTLLTILIRFLKSKDELSITTITEGRTFIPKKPELTIRSPEAFKLIDADNIKEAKAYKSLLTPAAVASVSVGFVLAVGIPSSSLTSDQCNNLVVAAQIAGIPALAEKYAIHKDVYYYPCAPLAYAYAVDSNNVDERKKYKVFLEKVLETSSGAMASTSECSIHYYLGRIEQLLDNKESAQSHFANAEKANSKHFAKLTKANLLPAQPPQTEKTPNKRVDQSR